MQTPQVNVQRTGYLAMAAAAAVLTLISLVSVASYTGRSAEVAELVDRYSTSDTPVAAADPNAEAISGPGRRAARSSADPATQQQVQRIAGRNMFSPPSRPGRPPAPVAIMGSEALCEDNSWVKVGDEYKGFKLLALGPDWAEWDVNGRAQRVLVFSESRGQGGQGRGAGPTSSGPTGRRTRDVTAGGGFFGRGGRGSDRFLQRLSDMPPEQRQRFLERMPPEMRQRFEQLQSQ